MGVHRTCGEPNEIKENTHTRCLPYRSFSIIIIRYTFGSSKAGVFYLTAKFNTWHYNQDLMVSINGAKQVEVPVFYSVGWWNRSQPIKATLVKGNNNMTFSRMSVRELVLKEFHLSPTEPVIPKPNGNFTPVPSPYVRRRAW